MWTRKSVASETGRELLARANAVEQSRLIEGKRARVSAQLHDSYKMLNSNVKRTFARRIERSNDTGHKLKTNCSIEYFLLYRVTERRISQLWCILLSISYRTHARSKQTRSLRLLTLSLNHDASPELCRSCNTTDEISRVAVAFLSLKERDIS